MTSAAMRQAALTARDAHLALLELKALVERAAQTMHTAELEMVGAAIGHSQGEDPMKTLHAAAQALQSPNFEAAISEAKSKMSAAADQTASTSH